MPKGIFIFGEQILQWLGGYWCHSDGDYINAHNECWGNAIIQNFKTMIHLKKILPKSKEVALRLILYLLWINSAMCNHLQYFWNEYF